MTSVTLRAVTSFWTFLKIVQWDSRYISHTKLFPWHHEISWSSRIYGARLSWYCNVTSAIRFVRAKKSVLVISHSGQFTSSTLLIIPKLFHYSFPDAAVQFLRKLLALPDEELISGHTKSFNAERFLQKKNHLPIKFRMTNRNLNLEGLNEP